jgi:fibro-slime domain-containing protein
MIDPVYVGLAVGSGDITYLDTAVFTNTGGIPINLRIDSTTVGRLSTPAKYNLYQLSRDVFAIATEGYAVKGATPVHAYATKLSQTLERQRTGTWTSSASGTALVPVTLYDMRADMSNPEFNVNGVEYAPCPPCTWSGKYMSAHIIRTDTLTADRKPMKKPLNAAGNAFRTQFMSCWSPTWYFLSPVNRASIANDGQTPACVDCESAAMHIDPTWPWCFNDSMHTWFRPYGDSIGKTGTYTFNTVTGKWSGLKMRPGWTPRFPGEDTEWVCQHADPTRPFTNIIMYDTLEFVERPQGSGVFFFGDTMKDPRWFMYGTMTHSGNCVYWPKPKFMPLQNRGFGYDCSNRYPIDPCEPSWTRQNFSFTMDFHRSFSYKPGQTFAFCGDDDIFVFINNRCVIDLGGIHDQVVASVNLDTLGLTVGKTYLFDFFYTERCVGGSNILVTTNMNFLAPSTPLKRSWKCDFGSLD